MWGAWQTENLNWPPALNETDVFDVGSSGALECPTTKGSTGLVSLDQLSARMAASVYLLLRGIVLYIQRQRNMSGADRLGGNGQSITAKADHFVRRLHTQRTLSDTARVFCCTHQFKALLDMNEG